MVRVHAPYAGALLLAVLVVASGLGLSLGTTERAGSHPMGGSYAADRPFRSGDPLGPFGNLTYNVTFNETGLPLGSFWSVTLNGTTNVSSNATIGFSEQNGTYAYTIADVSGWHQTTLPYNGNVVVFGGPVTEPTLIFTQVTYPVVFSESGLPPGETFQATLGGVPDSLTTDGGTDPLTFTEPNGTYAYSITDISGWHQTTLAYSGSVVVSNESVTELTLVYTQVTYTVVFSETGLPTGLTWQVTVNGAPNSLVTNGGTDSLTWTGLANGTSYAYSIAGIPGWHQTTLAYSGTIAVSGGTGPIDGTGIGYAITLVYTQVAYAVTFSESTLPAGLTWQITVNGDGEHLTTDGGPETLTWTGLANGSYGYSIADISGWHQTTLAYSGSIGVNGASVTEPALAYTNVTYSVVFSEYGLPPGLTWQVSVNGFTNVSTTNGLTDHLTWTGLVNRTYAYSITDISGWHQTTLAYSGSVKVKDGSVTEPTLGYTQVTYWVVLSESGLPPGLTWQVTVSAVPHTLKTDGETDPLNWTGLWNGTWAYSITGIPGWHQPTLAYNGSIVVSGGTGAINGAGIGYATTLAYTQVTYTVTFTESGLPSGLRWYVNITHPHRAPHNSTGGANVFYLSNGTYSYTVASADRVYAPALGSSQINVTGSSLSESVTFSELRYKLTFTEKGFPLGGGANWSITLGGSLVNSTTTMINFTVTNGTYLFTLGPVAGYTGTPSSGSITVSGPPVPRSIMFKLQATPPNNGTGAAPFQASDLIGGIVVAGVLGGVVVLILRRGKTPPKASRPHPSSGEKAPSPPR